MQKVGIPEDFSSQGRIDGSHFFMNIPECAAFVKPNPLMPFKMLLERVPLNNTLKKKKNPPCFNGSFFRGCTNNKILL